ncbi:hypothetical protein D3C84_629650 [compost metagenome]
MVVFFVDPVTEPVTAFEVQPFQPRHVLEEVRVAHDVFHELSDLLHAFLVEGRKSVVWLDLHLLLGLDPAHLELGVDDRDHVTHGSASEAWELLGRVWQLVELIHDQANFGYCVVHHVFRNHRLGRTDCLGMQGLYLLVQPRQYRLPMVNDVFDEPLVLFEVGQWVSHRLAVDLEVAREVFGRYGTFHELLLVQPLLVQVGLLHVSNELTDSLVPFRPRALLVAWHVLDVRLRLTPEPRQLACHFD